MSEAKRESKGPVRGYFFDKSVVVTGASSGIGHDVALNIPSATPAKVSVVPLVTPQAGMLSLRTSW